MKQTNTALNFQLAQYRAIFSDPIYVKGIASALVITAGAACNSAHAANNDDKLDIDEWFDALKDGSNTVTITGQATDSGASGKYNNITINAISGQTELKLQPNQQVLIQDTAHSYQDNYFKASGADKKLIVGGGGVVEVGSKEATPGQNQNPGLLVQASSGGYVNLNLSRLNVNNAELHVATAGMSTTSVGASNIFIGNGSGQAAKAPTAKVIVGDPKDGDGSGNTTFGKTWSKINVANNGEITVHASGKADIADFGSNIQATNVTINGGRLNFKSGSAGGKVNYGASNTDVNDGYVRFGKDSNVTLRVAKVNINDNSNVEIEGKLNTYNSHITVSNDATLAASSGASGGSAVIDVSDKSTLSISKSKVKEFLTGLRDDKSKVTYTDINSPATGSTTKDAGKGNISLSKDGTLVITDESQVDISDKEYFNFAADDKTSGTIYADNGSAIASKSIAVTKKVENASKLTVESENLTLGSDSFDSAATGTGVRRFFAKNVTFNPKSGENTYTLQDELNLSNDHNGTINGSVTVSGGSIAITGGSSYEMEQGKDLVLAKDRALSPKGTQSALYINDGSLKVSGKLQTTTSGSAYISNGSLDASEATIALVSQSIKMGNNSALALDGAQVLKLNADKQTVTIQENSFAKDTLASTNSSNIATVTLKNLGSMSMEQFNDLKKQTKFNGFYEGFSITDVKTEPELDFGQIQTGTPDEIYANTQVKTPRDIDRSVSVGNVEVSTGNKLVIQSQKDTGTLVKLTNAGANGNTSNNFVQDSSGQVANVDLGGLDSSLQLQGTGNIGDINGQSSNTGKLYIGTPDEVKTANVTVLGGIGNTNEIKELTVQAKSSLTVKGDTIRTSNLQIQPGSSITAQNADVTVSDRSSIYGDLKAKDLSFTKSDAAVNHVIAGGATVDVDKLSATALTTLQIGEDKQGGQSGTLIAKKLALSGGSVFVDPSYDVEASYAIVDNLSGNKYEHDAGTLSGSAVVGQNAVLAVGFDNKQDVVNIIKSKLNEHGAFTQGSDVQNALVLNKQITLTGKDSITIDAAEKDAAQAIKKAQASGNAITFGAGSAIVITDKAFSSNTANGAKSGTAISLKGDYTKVDASSGGQIILSGRFTAADKDIKIFDTTAGKTVNLTKDLDVSSANGLLSGKIKKDGDGKIDDLQFDTDRLRNMFKNTAHPVKEMLENTLAGQQYMFDDDSKAGAQFISHVATDSKTGVEADRALHAASYAGAQQAAIDASTAFTNSLHERGEAINSSYVARKHSAAVARANYKQDPQRKGNTVEVVAPVQRPSDTAGIWLTPTYVNTKTDDYDAENAVYGAEVDIKGITAGVDTRIGDTAFGIAASYGKGDSEGTGNGKGLKDEFDYYGLGLYSAMSFGQFSLIGDTSVTAMKHDISGASGIQGFGNLSTSVDSLAISAGITGKYLLETPFVDITPHFGTRFLRLSTDSYDLYSSEAKSNLLNTDYDTQNIFSFPIGVRLSKLYSVNGWILNPDIDLTVTMNTGDVDAKSSSKIYGMKDPLNLNTQIMDDVTYSAKVGFGITNGNFNSNFYFNYTGSDHSDSYGVSANVGYDF